MVLKVAVANTATNFCIFAFVQHFSKMILPPYLKPGSTIALCAPARRVSEEEMQPAVKIFESWGLRVKLGKNLFGEQHQFSGTDEQRAADLQELISDEGVNAIVSARGGYGCSRLLPMLDFSPLKKNPKWLVGYSDFTVFHLAMYRLGMQSFHATMPINFSDKQGVDSLRSALFGENISQQFAAHELNVKGAAQGRLIGGNLSIIYSLQGTPYALLPDNAILFIEDLDEYLYHVDRMMMSLELCGQLSKIKGLVVGGMSDMKDNTIPFGKNACEIIREHAMKFRIPIAFGFPAGHQQPNMAMRFGAAVELRVGGDGSELCYP